MSRLILALTLALVACASGPRRPGTSPRNAPPSLEELAARLDWASSPRLPSPTSATYRLLPQPPRDPMVAPLVAGLSYDGRLAAGAAGMALVIAEDVGTFTRWEVREALWRGGWPYPVDSARSWSAPPIGGPPPECLEWIRTIPKDEPMALVRARGRGGEIWVGMRTRQPVDLGSIPRMTEQGTKVPFPAVPGAELRVADGNGRMSRTPMDEPVTVSLTMPGEWLVQVVQDGSELARFPIYVGINPPEEPVLRLPEYRVTDQVEGAARQLDLLLQRARQHLGRPRWSRDDILDLGARRFVSSPERGVAEILAGLGFQDADAEVWACTEASIEDCVDRWYWDPRRRDAWHARRIFGYGAHGTMDARGVSFTVLLVEEPE